MRTTREAFGPHSVESEAPLTKCQLKHRRNKDSKLAKKFRSLDTEISNLKSQMEELEGKITKASESTTARFKRKKIRSEAGKIAEKLAESEAALRAVEPRHPKDPISRSPIELHPLNRNKRIDDKIADLNKKLRRARQNDIRSALIAKRDKLKR